MKKLYLSISFLIILIGFILFSFFSITYKFNTEDLKVSVFTEYKNDIHVYSMFRDVTKKSKCTGEVDINKIGDYNIECTYKNFIGLKRNKQIIVSVIDNTAPEVILKDKDIEVFLNEEYDEPGYEASDNYDKEVIVTVTGKVDTTKTGNYYLTYTATDTSGNKKEVVRKIVVNRVSPLSLSLSEFNLSNYFEDIILKKKENLTPDYMNNVVLAGDSVPWYFGLNGIFSKERVWAKPCVGTYNIFTEKVYYSNYQSDYTIPDLVGLYKPKYLVLHMGVCETNSGNINTFISSYEKFIDYMKEKHPYTTLIIQTLNPQTSEYLPDIPLRNNAKLNKYNYFIADMCRRKKVKILDTTAILKNKDGMCDVSLCSTDGYHPNNAGMNLIINLIKSHEYEE